MLPSLRSWLAAALVLGFAAGAESVPLEIEINVTNVTVRFFDEPFENGQGGGDGVPPQVFVGVDFTAIGQYDSDDVTLENAFDGLVEFIAVDLEITFSDGLGTFNTIGMGVWDIDDIGGLLVSNVPPSFGFELFPIVDPGDSDFDLSQPFDVAEFVYGKGGGPPFPTEEGPFISVKGGGIASGAGAGDDVILDDDVPPAGTYSVAIRGENPIPEPTSAFLFAGGLLVTLHQLRRRR